MKCQNCPLCVSDYIDACGDGDIYCLITGDYAKDEGGCSRTNKWILAQDIEALKKKREEEECAAWSAMAEYYENTFQLFFIISAWESYSCKLLSHKFNPSKFSFIS